MSSVAVLLHKATDSAPRLELFDNIPNDKGPASQVGSIGVFDEFGLDESLEPLVTAMALFNPTYSIARGERENDSVANPAACNDKTDCVLYHLLTMTSFLEGEKLGGRTARRVFLVWLLCLVSRREMLVASLMVSRACLFAVIDSRRKTGSCIVERGGSILLRSRHGSP